MVVELRRLSVVDQRWVARVFSTATGTGTYQTSKPEPVSANTSVTRKNGVEGVRPVVSAYMEGRAVIEGGSTFMGGGAKILWGLANFITLRARFSTPC